MKLWVGIKHNWLSRLNRVESDCQHFHGGIPVKRLFTLMADISWKKKSANSIRASNECQTLRISAARKPKKQHDKSSINYRSIVNLRTWPQGVKNHFLIDWCLIFRKSGFGVKTRRKRRHFFWRTSTPIGCTNRWTGVGWESFSQMIFFVRLKAMEMEMRTVSARHRWRHLPPWIIMTNYWVIALFSSDFLLF